MPQESCAQSAPSVPAASSAPHDTLTAVFAEHEPTFDAALLRPGNAFWHEAGAAHFAADNLGRPVPGMETTVLARWTAQHLYLLFECAYDNLHLRPQPDTSRAIWQLWDWDVAEIFIGCDPESERHYKEFQISPQAEWLDLDIDLDSPTRTRDAAWASGFGVLAEIVTTHPPDTAHQPDEPAKLWRGIMQIPFAALNAAPRPGLVLRANLFRSQGPGHQLLAWQPSMSETFHVPERFGRIVLG